MFSEKIRREAMERARDQNEPALSGKVTLVQETEEAIQAGTLMYLPVFRRAAPVASIAEKRAALLGWVYCPFRMDDLMRGIMKGRNLEDSRRMRLEIFDGKAIAGEALLHDSMRGSNRRVINPEGLTLQRRIVSAGRPWTLRFSTIGRAAGDFVGSKVWLVALGGASSSLLLSGLFFSLLNTSFRARQLADRLTADLKASEERSRAIADYTVGWETWFGLDGKILWVNPGVERITGYSPAEVLAMPDLASVMIAPADRDSFRALVKEMVLKREGDDREFQCRRKDGSKLWLSISWQPIFDRAGNSLGLRASGRDITKLKQAEANLQRANWVVEQTNTSIMITDLCGDIEYVNTEFTQVTGFSKEEAVGKNPRFLQSGLTSRAIYEELWRELFAGRSWHGEFQNRRKNGEIYWESVAISPLRTRRVASPISWHSRRT
jgi:PAS domain S-box-containing protein